MTTMNSALPRASLSPEPRRNFRQVLLSYFYWTYTRGSFHYDVMVTLSLLFICVTPQIPGWSYGDKPLTPSRPMHPMQVVGNDGHGLLVMVQGEDVDVPAGSSEKAVRQLLRKTIGPVTGGEVTVERWDTVRDAAGNVLWRVWAHR
jgi:hypothetical protein